MRAASSRYIRPFTLGDSMIMRRTLSSRHRYRFLNIEASLFASVSSPSLIYHDSLAIEKQNHRNFSIRPTAAFPFGVFATPTPINIRRMVTKVSVLPSNAPLSSLSPDKKEFLNDLRCKTEAWLQIPVNSWTQREVSKGRFLIREWSGVNNSSATNNGNDNDERAVQQTQILRRWMKERKAAVGNDRLQSIFQLKGGKNNNNDSNSNGNADSQEMVQMLNRCLDSWRKAATVPRSHTTKMGTTDWNKCIPQSESMGLIHLFCDASELLNDKYLRPNHKTYSMCMNVLSLHPKSSTVCDDVLSLLNQCRETTKPDLQFFNVCLHTLAKCATYHSGAPILVERVFREMTSTSDLSPNTACFVSVLHAWANSIPATAAKGHRHRGGSEKDNETTTSAAERAEAILHQMLRDYPQLVDTICFNICIDAWGKEGDPEKAEAILRRLEQYHRYSESGNKGDVSVRRKTAVRPNQISFNSAINAWSKSASRGGNDGRDKQKAADRAGQLLQQMKIQGFDPSPETFGSIMEAYSNTINPGVRVQSFLDELEKMYSEGAISVPPPKVCYLMAIRAWGRTKPGGAKRAESLVRRLEEVCSREDGDWTPLEPCTIIYTSLISAWAQSDTECAPDRARDIFREMGRKAKLERKNTSPNIITLNTVLEAFCNHGQIEEAQKFLATMKRGVRPDTKSYMTILKAYAKSSLIDAAENAQEFLRELEDDYRSGEGTTKPTVRMYSQLLVAWGNSPKSDAAFRAEELFWQMMRQEDDSIGVLPDTATFNCVLRAWSKSFEGGAAERAEALLQKVREEHSGEISIDPVTHLHLIFAWAHSRRRKAPIQAEKHLEQARALCHSGKHSDRRLIRAHFNGTILAWKKSNDSNAAWHIRKLQDERDSTTGY